MSTNVPIVLDDRSMVAKNSDEAILMNGVLA